MCTVTFLPLGDTIVFTSNRDEALSKPLAFAPALSEINGKKILFPKDPRAGGTWFACAADSAIAVLLNGAFTRHIPTGNYRRSRGLVLLDIIAAVDPFAEIHAYDFTGIEPFTLILFRPGHVMLEFRWDGSSRYYKDLDQAQPYIYSSATLYEPAIIHQREEWFREFLKNGEVKTPQSIIAFHSSAGRADAQNGLVMSRGELLKTQCITQAVMTAGAIDLYHHDLIQGTEAHSVLPVLS